MAQLVCKDLALGYDGEVIQDKLNFEVAEGDYLCIVGENGSGKSTLMKTILGLTKPMGGEVLFDDGLTAKTIGYLPQQTVVQRDFPASVREIVLSGCQGRGQHRFFYSAEDKALAKKNMERMDIYDLRNRCYRELSGGQQQRVLLARALCATKKMLLLDEPVTGLDPKVASELYQLVEDINKKDHISVIMISHDIQAAVQYAKHILHVGGRTFYGTRDAYVNSALGRQFINFEAGEEA
ncbi:MAG: ATP-binding cassette domain-containing protein [Lachnospiraceae bacterium]|nr:ATP-binding cassette domain-containing protein [Lachnospiraceae bacterium]